MVTTRESEICCCPASTLVIRVRVYPDVSEWDTTDLRYVAGYGGGLFADFAAEDWKKARETYNDAYELGFSVSMEFQDQ